MIVLVTGGRDYEDRRSVFGILIGVDQDTPIELVMQGGCPSGADRLARLWADENERDVLTCNARWKAEKNAAGPIRNSRMAARPYGIRPDLCLVFPGGRGTADMKRKAIAAGIPTRDVR